ncbi:MAG TPA: UDP-N-acetylmuramoyl-tripeptide--D-alanyl-D-alanine ligase [Pseudogracilibacillus sp.]|nr:UDP-N-acetylmuramoyl-tripeptide--D-alanyl-D-alanine ligase [Pseudogracilibacillus sp.]
MLFTGEFLQQNFSKSEGKLKSNMEIRQVMTDSRQFSANSLFIPIVGERFDGHQFLAQAIENGAVAVLWDEKHKIPEAYLEKVSFFIVEDTLKAMKHLAHAYRQLVSPIVIGITGSNGKTTTKDLVYATLHQAYRSHKTEGNFNNEIGLPLTILSMPRDTEVLILEMGMNHFHEIERLSKLSQPDYAIITNIGESHIEYLGSREGIAKAKLEIKTGLKESGNLLIDGDESLLQKEKNEENTVGIGFLDDNDVVLSNANLKDRATHFQYGATAFQVPLLGKHHAKNAAFAIWLAYKLSVTDEQIQQGLQELAYTSMRFEWLEGKHQSTLINDAYNASYTSMKAAIDVLKDLKGFSKKVVVLGDILELGEFEEQMHKQIGTLIHSPITHLFTTGDAASAITKSTKANGEEVKSKHFTERLALSEAIERELEPGTIVLFKASRGMHFEQFVEACREMPEQEKEEH